MSQCDPCEFPIPPTPDVTGKCRSAKVVVGDGVSGRFKQTVANGASGKFVQNSSTEDCSCSVRLTPSPNVFPISPNPPVPPPEPWADDFVNRDPTFPDSYLMLLSTESPRPMTLKLNGVLVADDIDFFDADETKDLDQDNFEFSLGGFVVNCKVFIYGGFLCVEPDQEFEALRSISIFQEETVVLYGLSGDFYLPVGYDGEITPQAESSIDDVSWVVVYCPIDHEAGKQIKLLFSVA